MLDARLLHDGIGRVARPDFPVHHESALTDRAEPDIMIALTVPHEPAIVLGENPTHVDLITGHQVGALGFNTCDSRTA